MAEDYDFEIKQGATLPSLEITLAERSSPINLSSADQIRLRIVDEMTLVPIVSSNLDSRSEVGLVTYEWASVDTAVDRGMIGEVEVTWQDGSTQIWGDFKIRVKKSFGA